MSGVVVPFPLGPRLQRMSDEELTDAARIAWARLLLLREVGESRQAYSAYLDIEVELRRRGLRKWWPDDTGGDAA